MKKIAVLAAAVLGLSSMTLSQADDVIVPNIETPAETALKNAAEAQDMPLDEVLQTKAADAASETAAADPAVNDEVELVEEVEVTVPQDTPQVQKLLNLYPLLVQRIKPYGEVCYVGEPCDITLTASGGSADGEPRSGDAVYSAVCSTCHATGLLGSPAFGDAGAWGPRIAKGMDTLNDHAINGFNAMPAKGGADIPDEEVINAVDYMVENAS